MESVLRCLEIRLKNYEPVCYIRCPERTRILQFGMLKADADALPSHGTWREDTLYYVDEAALRRASLPALPCNLICCGTSASCPEDHNLIRLGRPADPEELTCVIEELLEQIAQYEQMMHELLQIMDRADCMKELIACCSRRMHMGITVHDTSFRHIAVSERSTVPEFFTPVFDRALSDSFLSEESLSQIEDLNILHSLYNGDPYVITDYQELSKVLSIPEHVISVIYLPLHSGAQPIAYLSVVSFDRDLDAADAAMVMDMGRLLSLALVRDGLVRVHVYGSYSALLHDVITSSLTDDDIIRTRLRSLKWTVAEDLYVVALVPEAGYRKGNLARFEEIQQQFMDIVPGSICDVYQDTMYFLIGRRAGEEVIALSHRRLMLFLRANHSMLGISCVFHSPSQLHRYFLEACTAVSIGRRVDPGHGIYVYTDYTPELSVLALIRSPDLEAEDFCHPVVRSLRDSPRPADHDLLDTLEQYLFNLKDVNRTCDALHIHRSTLFYRLNKLKSLLGEDAFNDAGLVQRLMYSFTVLHCLEAAQGREE